MEDLHEHPLIIMDRTFRHGHKEHPSGVCKAMTHTFTPDTLTLRGAQTSHPTFNFCVFPLDFHFNLLCHSAHCHSSFSHLSPECIAVILATNLSCNFCSSPLLWHPTSCLRISLCQVVHTYRYGPFVCHSGRCPFAFSCVSKFSVFEFSFVILAALVFKFSVSN